MIENRERPNCYFFSLLEVRVYLILFLLSIIFFRNSSWLATNIIWLPKNINLNLLPDRLTPYDLANHPWIIRVDKYKQGWSWNVLYIVLRYPLVDMKDRCISSDGLLINYACPYKVNITLDLDQDKNWRNYFDLIKIVELDYPNENLNISVSSVGTVILRVPNYTIVLGRKNIYDRYMMAYKNINSPSWRYTSGKLDMRYRQGFAFKSYGEHEE